MLPLGTNARVTAEMTQRTNTSHGGDVARDGTWRWFLASRMGRVALNVRAALRGEDLLKENLRLARVDDGSELARVQADYVIRSMVDRDYDDALLPPPDLRLKIGSTDAYLEFLAKGVRSSGIVLDTFGEDPGAPVLDWGCGSGRTHFWLGRYDGWRAHYHGCDVDPAAVAWLREKGVDHVEVSGVTPPLPYGDAQFAGLFAFSVLTHIPAEAHEAWYDEFARVVAPGGRIVFSVYGAAQARRSPTDVQEAFARDEYAWRACRTPDHHYKDKCIVSEAFTRRLLDGTFEVEQYLAEGYAHWNDRGQDLVVARRAG